MESINFSKFDSVALKAGDISLIVGGATGGGIKCLGDGTADSMTMSYSGDTDGGAYLDATFVDDHGHDMDAP